MPDSLPIDSAPKPPRRISRATRLPLAFLAAAAAVGGGATLYAVLVDDPSLRAPQPAVLLVTALVAITTIVADSIRQIHAARQYVPRGVRLVQGAVLELPFAQETTDLTPPSRIVCSRARAQASRDASPPKKMAADSHT